MRVIVTGATGFLGRTIARHFSEEGWDVFGLGRTAPGELSRSLHDYIREDIAQANLPSLFQNVRPDLIVHAAGTANVAQSMVEPEHDFSGSVLPWIRVLDGVRLSALSCRLVFLSSAAVYGLAPSMPISEVSPLAPVSPYGHHKRMCEELGAYYAQLYTVRVCNLRIFSAYGPGLRRQILWDITRKALSTDTVELNGTGRETRDFVEVRDVARAVECVSQRGNFCGESYNVAGGTPTSVSALASLLVSELGTHNIVHFNDIQRSGDPARYEADTSLLASLGFFPRISLEGGVRRYAEWIHSLGAGVT